MIHSFISPDNDKGHSHVSHFVMSQRARLCLRAQHSGALEVRHHTNSQLKWSFRGKSTPSGFVFNLEAVNKGLNLVEMCGVVWIIHAWLALTPGCFTGDWAEK